MGQEEQEVYKLSDLNVESVGLVFRGANRKPFYVIKSQSQEVDSMSENQEDFAAILDELEGVSEVNETAWSKMVGVLKSLTAKPEPEPEPEPEEIETSSETETDDFAEAIRLMKTQIEEQFAVKLEHEREARRTVEEAFAQEQKKRRLAEFGAVAEQFTGLPGADENFAADLMAIADADAEVYTRLTAILKAANEAIEKGALFEQFAVGGSGAGTGDEFENKVEAIRQKRFSDEKFAVGWSKALDIAMVEHRDLAAKYARKH